MFLILAQIPPPVHGAAVMNERSAEIIKTIYPKSILINTSSALDVSDIGRISMRKIFKLTILYSKIIWALIRKDVKYCYINLHPIGKVFLRDATFCFLAKLFQKKVILHIHSRGISKSQPWILNKIYKATFNNTYVIHLSDIFFDELAPFVDRARFLSIPNCTDDFQHLSKTKPDRNLQFYYISNYIKGKGALELLNAAKYIYHEHINCRFVLAGGWFEPEFKDEIDQWKKENSILFETDYIKVLGPLYGKDKDELIRNSDAFIFPSYIDTFPLVVLEALSSGKLIISTSTGATPEILAYGKAGILVPEKNHLALAEKILEVIQNPDVIQVYSKAARSQYLSTYSKQHFKTALTQKIKEITLQQAIR